MKKGIIFLVTLISLFISTVVFGQSDPIRKELDLLRIEIPRLNIDMEIEKVPFDEKLKTWDITELVGKFYWLEGTSHPEYGGNTVLAAHYMEYGEPGPMFRVRDFKPGDEIYLYSEYEKYTYTVEKYQYIPDSYTKYMENDPYKLTLFTCSGFNWDNGNWEQRVLVFSDLTAIDMVSTAETDNSLVEKK